MAWDAVLLGFVGTYATYKTSDFARQFENLVYWGYALAAFFFTLGQGSYILDAILNSYNLTIWSGQVMEWTAIISISFLLSGLAVLIRQSKPVFARFPLVYAGMPLILILTYWLVKDTLAIKEWLMSIYQGGALLVGLLMYGVHSYRAKRFRYLFASILLFFITFAIYWFVPGMKNNYIWIWELLLGGSIIASVYGLEYSLANFQNKSN